MIEVQHLSRAYGPFLAVDDVSFNIGPGEIVGLLGHNGAGKTTIMKMVTGYLEPSSGTVNVDGIDLAADRIAVQQRIGYLPESLPLYPEMSIADYLDYAARLKGLDDVASRKAIRRAVEATELSDRLLDPIATLSRGYRQRVGVAQALLGDPRVLILDEPTNGLDPTQTQHMRALIVELAKSATVILSTHIMQEVDAVCDRVLMLRAGRLAVDARLDELRQSRRLRVATDLDEAPAKALIGKLEGVVSVSAGEGAYRVDLAPEAEVETVANAIAQALVSQGHALYGLSRELRDLESVFREVNEGREVRHAA
ncbi:MAG: ATP-binding cassette domain-containing protein [Gammaproteobacteria bacterium]